MDRKLLHDCIDQKLNKTAKHFHLPNHLMHVFYSAVNNEIGNLLDSPGFKAKTSHAITEVLRKQQEQIIKDQQIAAEIYQKYKSELQEVSEIYSVVESELRGDDPTGFLSE